MECRTTGMKTMWTLVAGPSSPAHLKTLSLASEFVLFNGLVIWLHRNKLHFRFWVLQGSSKPISFCLSIWGRWKSHKSLTSVRKTERIWLFTTLFPLIFAWLTRKRKKDILCLNLMLPAHFGLWFLCCVFVNLKIAAKQQYLWQNSTRTRHASKTSDVGSL
jgi:hypothetical protein